jgi:hypothetical protein
MPENKLGMALVAIAVAMGGAAMHFAVRSFTGL